MLTGFLASPRCQLLLTFTSESIKKEKWKGRINGLGAYAGTQDRERDARVCGERSVKD